MILIIILIYIKIGSVIGGEFQSHLKNINYETKNVDEFKDDFTSEIYGALGYLAKIDLFKNLNNTNYFLTPKFFKICTRKYEKRTFG